MNRTVSSAERVYCADLAKNKFQLHVYSVAGERLERLTLSRAKFDAYFASAKRKQGLVVTEACGSSYFWGRRFERRGFQVKLVPPQFVAKQRMGNKNDGNDADAIFAVHRDPRVRPVPIKSLAQQDLAAEHRLRELLVKQRTQFANQVRGLLAERGWVAPRGARGLAELLRRIDVEPDAEITPALVTILKQIAEQIARLNDEIAAVERRLSEFAKNEPVVQMIDSIFGVATLTATAFYAEFGHRVERFADSRQFAAGIGLTPGEHSTGETRRLSGVTKRGNPYLRRLLVQCAQSVVQACTRRDDPLALFARRMSQSKKRNTAVVAVANRLARIIYAVIKHREPYRSKTHPQPA